LNKLVVNTCFTGAISRIEGLGFDDLAEEALAKHFDAYAPKFEQPVLNEGGVYQWKRKGEYHMYNPQTVDLLQKATRNNDYETFKKYSRAANNLTNNAATLRSLLEFKNDRPAIPIEEVEPVENILKRLQVVQCLSVPFLTKRILL
jgi:glutamate synthase (NADPH/NADH) large chain